MRHARPPVRRGLMDPQRRGFLRGDLVAAGTPPANPQPRFADNCLARRKVECRVCGEACDAGAIRFRPALGGVSQPELRPDACTGCGDCVAPCPVAAITMLPGS